MDASRRQWLKLHERNIWRRRARNERRSNGATRCKRGYATVITAPPVVTIADMEHRRHFLAFLSQLRGTRTRRGRHLIDFSSTTHINADGMILFRAELCNIIKNEHAGCYRCKAPHSVKIKEVLYQTGIFQVVGQEVSVRPKHPDVVHWKTAHGYRAEGEKPGTLLDEYEGQVAQALLSDLFVGVTEAMTNVHHHAYIRPLERSSVVQYCRRDADKGNGWWMFSQKKDGYLHVVICDLGVGIPGSLPDRKPNVFRRLLSLGVGDRDSKFIEFAIEESTSRTRQSHRGKGLGQIVNCLIGHSEDSEILIFSNRGFYRRRKDGVSSFDYKDTIMGTVICWRTPLAA